MPSKFISVKGARENNLKNIDLKIPRDKLIVFTGLSGSGKSSLAFDTIYAEGQRRYVESLSSYARMFLGQMEKPDVDYIDGLSPAISIDQKTTSKNPRSTVGTVTEVYDYLRLLYARIGIPHCPKCGREIRPQTVDEIVESIFALPERTKFILLAPIVRDRKGEHSKEIEAARKSGFSRVRVDGITFDLSEDIQLEKNKKHSIEVEVDRLMVGEKYRSRTAESIETATKLSGGVLIVDVVDGENLLYSLNYACPEHGACFEELNPRMFSFNNPSGACKTCSGLGVCNEFSPDLVFSDKSLSINEGAVKAFGWSMSGKSTIAGMYFDGLSKKYGFSLDTPVEELSKEALDVILYGTKGEKMKLERPTSFGGGIYYTDYEGIINNLKRRYAETTSEIARNELEQYMISRPCPDCGGARLSPEVLAVTVDGVNIAELTTLSIDKLAEFFDSLPEKLSERENIIATQIIKEISSRLTFLNSVGLGYLTLARSAGTLSGGESQRIRLATQLGTSLVGVLYILDEPSIGLHQKDNEKLIGTLQSLRDIGNTVIVVEHDEETMRAADYLVDIGPGAGVNGGEVVVQGSLEEIESCSESITGQYLSGVREIPIPSERRKGNGKELVFRGCAENNLKNIDISVPLGKFVCVTGVSGSGKSSFVNEILYKTLASRLNGAKKTAGRFGSVEGCENLDKIVFIDQSPIGKTPRSNPATYTDLFTLIRNLFAQTKDAKAKGYSAGRFSFNVKGGRCEACEGDGIKKIEMHFLADVYVPCEVCGGKRYNAETLSVRFNGKSIHDVLEMTVVEAMEFFKNIPKISDKLKTLYDVGLGYIKLGQSSTTLSGGEAQRVKLASELSKRGTGKTIYVLDEPTTGLHTFDVQGLIKTLQAFVDKGNTVLIIEHNLDVIKTADHVIDLGPDGGEGGGRIVAEGTPEEVAKVKGSYTGEYLKRILK